MPRCLGSRDDTLIAWQKGGMPVWMTISGIPLQNVEATSDRAQEGVTLVRYQVRDLAPPGHPTLPDQTPIIESRAPSSVLAPVPFRNPRVPGAGLLAR